MDNITIVKPRPTTITVNGVPLMDVQMRRRLARVSKATPNKRKLETVKKNRKTTTPSVANNKKIWEYMIEKKARIEDNKDRVDDDDQVPASSGEDNVVNKPSGTTAPTKTKNECDDSKPGMKKTFGTTVIKKRNNVSDRILKFQDLVNGDDCVVRSGFCVTHNLKTIREIVSVRTSSLDKNDRVGWRLSDSAVMCCPRAQPRKPTSALNTGEALLPEWGKTNGQNDKIVDDKLEPIT